MRMQAEKKTQLKIINYLNSRFGIEKEFFNKFLFIVSGKSIYIINNEYEKIILKQLNTPYIKNIGIELFSNYNEYTPSSLGFGIFKKEQIKNNYLILTRKQTIQYFNGKKILIKEIENKTLLSSGFVICIFENNIVGCAKYLKEKEEIEPSLPYINDKIK